MFWRTRWWHGHVLRHTVVFKEMPLDLFDSECSCGFWWWNDSLDWDSLR